MESDEMEVRFLRTAGVLALAGEAGLEPRTASEALPVAPAEEVRQPDTPRLRAAAAQLISSGPAEVLTELLELLTEKGLTLPAGLLPALLGCSTNKPVVRSAIGKMPGKRHRWLASLNPEWKAVLNEEITVAEYLDERLWTDGSLPERIAVLRQVRQREPARARELLAAALPKEAAKERSEMLPVLAAGLSPEDAVFLTSVLADKSKGVRQIAAAMLSNLPQSEFARRMTTRLAEMVKVEKKLLRSATLEVALPEKFDAEWSKDGIEEKPVQGEGAKACWLRQMTWLTPLAWWSGHTGLTPAEVIALMAKSDWAAPLLTGVMQAIASQQNATWARALIAHGTAGKVNLDFSEIAGVAGVEAVEQWLTGMTENGEFNHALGHAIQLQTWSEPFANLMMAHARRVAAKEPDYTFYTQLPAVALRLPVSRLSAAAEDWEDFIDRPYLRPALDSFLQSIQLRKTIHEELQSL
jgi:hypothetical protein